MTLQDENQSHVSSLDPFEFYRTTAIANSNKAEGFEKLVYDVFGSNVIATLSFYLDPAVKVPKIPRHLIESEIRYRKRLIPSSFYSAPLTTRIRSRSNFKIPGSTLYPPLIDSWVSVTNAQGTVSASQSGYTYTSTTPIQTIPHFSKDTIFSKRSPLTKKWGGPFEKFRSGYSIPKLTCFRETYSTVMFAGTKQQSDSTLQRTQTIDNYCRVTTSDQNTQLALEQARATSVMNKFGHDMLSKLLPDIARFDLTRSIAELKDLRTSKNPLELIKETRDKFKSLKGNSDLFLAEQFGLLPLVSDVEKWLALPDQIAKQVNFLLSRSGKPTTLHSKRILDPSTTVASFQGIGGVHSDFIRSTGPVRFQCDTELRMSVNVNFEFPPIRLPGLQDEKLRRLWGVNPSISTVYELTPWSWLIDWFSGLGDYISMIEKFHSSDTIINYGFLTYQSKGKLTQDNILSSLSSHIYDIRPGSYNSYPSAPTRVGKAMWSYDYQKRIWLHDIDVQSASKPEFLNSDFQKSIILALFGQRLL